MEKERGEGEVGVAGDEGGLEVVDNVVGLWRGEGNALLCCVGEGDEGNV